MMFKGDGTLTYVNPSDYDNIKREGTYTIGQKESFVVNKKTQYRVKITTTISGKQTIYYVVSFDGTYLFKDEKGHNPSFTAGKDVTISLIDHPELYEKKKESAETEVIAIYVGAEYEGTCNLHFKEEDSSKLDFKYQWVEQYASGMAECTLNEIYKGKKFMIKYKFDNIKVYMNGSEFYVWEKKILSIELIE